MQRQGFWRLYSWLISLHRASGGRRPAQGAVQGALIETSASPVLTYTVIVLLLVLAILEVDLHRDELRALGFISGEEDLASSLVGP